MRPSLRTALVTVATAGAVLTPAAAAAADTPAASPAAYCTEHRFVATTWDGRTLDAYWIPLRSAGQAGDFRFPILSLQGCVSTVAAGMGEDGFVASSAISVPAAAAQCAWLEQVRGLRYPTTMYGTDVHNRTGCAKVLQAALAVLPPPPGGPPV